MLPDERTRGRQEEGFFVGKPGKEVSDEDGRDMGLSQACGQTNQRVAMRAGADDVELILPDLRVARELLL